MIWQVEVVSFGAVAGTCAFSLYYFNQFPLLFPVTNLIAMPAAFFLVSGTALILALSPFPFLSFIAGKAVSLVSALLRKMTSVLSGWDTGVIENIHIDEIEVILITGGFLVAVHSLGRSGSIYTGLRNMLVLLLMILCYHLTSVLTELRSQELFHDEKTGVLRLTGGDVQYVFIPDGSSPKREFAIQGHLDHYRVSQSDTIYLKPQTPY